MSRHIPVFWIIFYCKRHFFYNFFGIASMISALKPFPNSDFKNLLPSFIAFVRKFVFFNPFAFIDLEIAYAADVVLSVIVFLLRSLLLIGLPCPFAFVFNPSFTSHLRIALSIFFPTIRFLKAYFEFGCPLFTPLTPSFTNFQ